MLKCSSCQAYLCASLQLAFDFSKYKERCLELQKALLGAHEKFCFWPDSPCPVLDRRQGELSLAIDRGGRGGELQNRRREDISQAAFGPSSSPHHSFHSGPLRLDQQSSLWLRPSPLDQLLPLHKESGAVEFSPNGVHGGRAGEPLQRCPCGRETPSGAHLPTTDDHPEPGH
ncbi:hypothetical protein E2320_004395 [Naja naja]|nr:hypothetical protein E2320_004395 [Naja naja]